MRKVWKEDGMEHGYLYDGREKLQHESSNIYFREQSYFPMSPLLSLQTMARAAFVMTGISHTHLSENAYRILALAW
jgi:hypothetical protein